MDVKEIDNERVQSSEWSSDEVIIVLDVGGTVFKTLRSTLMSVKNTRLSRLVESDAFSNDANEKPKEYFFDRNAHVFQSILDFYRFGELHIPSNVCSKAVKKDLEFWDITETFVSECCKGAVKEAEQSVALKSRMAAMFADKGPSCGPLCDKASWMKKAQYKVWLGMEYPGASIPGRVYTFIYVLLTLASVMTYILVSSPSFRMNTGLFNATNITNPKESMYLSTDIYPSIMYIDNICMAFFTCELFVRFLMYPSKRVFMRTYVNVLDLVCLLMNVLNYVLWILFNDDKDMIRNIMPIFLVLTFVCVLRMFRLVSFTYHLPLVKVLVLSLVESWRVLLLMLAIMIIGTLIFGPLIYIADYYNEETFQDVPIACWWAIVTMTTVGYGDQHPGSFPGYVIGSLCALTGLVLTALPIAVIGNNFNRLYSFVKDKQLEKQVRKSEDVQRVVDANLIISNKVHAQRKVAPVTC